MEEVPTDAAVTVRDAYKFYGSKKKPNVVLNHLNMTVPRGTIYGLLGASGCGKSTLLTCLVGLRDPQAGRIRVLDQQPGAPDSHVPGPAVGYMPQDVALLGDFTISNTMFYFGRIFGMSSSQIEERAEFLQRMLDLPPEGSFVGKLSGGQQRRVSLAAALLHDPELLILDEPTVGLDPVLRQRIWDYLKQITQVENKAVIITTHYIEEARQADMIGLMRHGQLLAEDSPPRLLARHGCDTLEEVFLLLSRSQSEQGPAPSLPLCAPPLDPEPALSIEEFPTSKSKPVKYRSSRTGKMHSLLKKNVLRYVRNTSLMTFILGFPVLQIAIFFLAVSFEPRNLPLGVVNLELAQHLGGECGDLSTSACNDTNLGCRFLASLSPDLITQVQFADVASAEAAARAGHVWGVLHVGANFSTALAERYENGQDTSDAALDQAEVQVRLDMSDNQIGYFLRKEILDSYKQFFKELLTDCEVNPRLGYLPLKFEAPVYGLENPTFVLFMAPGMILNIVFFLSNGVTCTTMLSEVVEGIWNRALVAGVTTGEILASHVITQTFILVVQTLECLLLSLLVFGVYNNGSLALVVSLTLLEGFCGMCFGILISIICENMTAAIYLALGNFIPMLVLCGILWPVEGMPWLLRVFSQQLPLTSGTESLRNILTKGWGLTYPGVYKGFLTTTGWTLAILVACFIGMRIKKT